MSSPAIAVPRPSRTTLLLVVAVICGFVAWFLAKKWMVYTHYDAVSYDDLWPRRFIFLPHLVGGSVAAITGVVQIWLGLTGRTRELHRILGRLYLGGIAIGSVSAFGLALTTVNPPTLSYRAGLFTLGIAWLITTGMAWVAIRQRHVEQHREWMLRSYTVTFAFVTFRFLAQWLIAFGVPDGPELEGALAWGSWCIPLLLAEPLIQLRRLRLDARRRAVH
jgi:uncharacterized membrane protein YozB (DUF420 family)